jgi:hypothetical protein
MQRQQPPAPAPLPPPLPLLPPPPPLPLLPPPPLLLSQPPPPLLLLLPPPRMRGKEGDFGPNLKSPKPDSEPPSSDYLLRATAAPLFKFFSTATVILHRISRRQDALTSSCALAPKRRLENYDHARRQLKYGHKSK